MSSWSSRSWWSAAVAALVIFLGAGAGCSGIDTSRRSLVGVVDDASASDATSFSPWRPDAALEAREALRADGGCDGADAAGCAGACGNGLLNSASESCDDGNLTGGDGCSATCQTESDWFCATPGRPCVSKVACGDGVIAGSETCDDHNVAAGDGCSASCTTELGWVCPAAGARCVPRCGDGLRVGDEKCDDGNLTVGDGCSDACRVEGGFACPLAGPTCHQTVCGDHLAEGDESCDDGNRVGGDGCTSDCRAEPVCSGTSGCSSPCGDGLKLPGEACDDGNLTSGDGCSATCTLEAGWECQDVGAADDGHLTVDVVYRDFMARGLPGGHPNFEAEIHGLCTGMMQPVLGADRTPVMVAPSPSCSVLTTAADFAQWYHDSALGKTVADKVTLVHQANGTYLYDHSQKWSGSATTGWTLPPFFPLDTRGWAEPPAGPEIAHLANCGPDNVAHNFGFTSAVRTWFAYQGGETLDFIGDDDVWVFVNGQLVVDLGGVHGPVGGSVVLDAAAATRLGLALGKVYEIAVFQAERHTCGSSYKLTLGNFDARRTLCQPRCGDAIVNGTELCDDGKNDGGYGGCMPGCHALGPICGDGKVEPSVEACDDGVNRSTYGQAGCAPGCRTVPRCGDGRVDALWSETCDDGNSLSLDGCSSSCRIEIL